MHKLLEIINNEQQSLSGRIPDFKQPVDLLLVRNIAGMLLECTSQYTDLEALERYMTEQSRKASFSNLLHMATKLAKSKTVLLGSDGVHVSIVLPAYGENRRMMPRGNREGQDPDGEDFIREKDKQLHWLFESTQCTYQVYIVDDLSKKDPVRSGDAARHIIEAEGIPSFKVLFIEDAIRDEKEGETLVSRVLAPVTIPKNSKKAAAVYYGAAKAIESFEGQKPHVVYVTDCDLSIDVAQIGNLIYPILNGAMCGAGSRRLQESILELESSRNIRANAARYLRKLTFGDLLPKDTQCGAKAFSAHAFQEVLWEGMETLDYSYDIELLTRVAIKFGPQSVVPVAVGAFDSAALTTTDSSVHFTILKTQMRIARMLQVGHGGVFDTALSVSEVLATNESVWLGYLDLLSKHPDLIERQNRFDETALNETMDLARSALSSIK